VKDSQKQISCLVIHALYVTMILKIAGGLSRIVSITQQIIHVKKEKIKFSVGVIPVPHAMIIWRLVPYHLIVLLKTTNARTEKKQSFPQYVILALHVMENLKSVVRHFHIVFINLKLMNAKKDTQMQNLPYVIPVLIVTMILKDVSMPSLTVSTTQQQTHAKTDTQKAITQFVSLVPPAMMNH